MKPWRPEKWENEYQKYYASFPKGTDINCSNCEVAYEAGADAMLESLASLVGDNGWIQFEKEDGKVVAVYIIRRLKNE